MKDPEPFFYSFCFRFAKLFLPSFVFMKPIHLVVPSSQYPRDWFKFINDSLDYVGTSDNVIIDFNIVNFLETDDFVVLACLIECFFIENAKISFIGGTKKFNAHLNNIKFKNYWSENFDRSAFTLSRNNSTLCLWKISQNQSFTYSMFAKKHFSKMFLNDKDLVPVASNLEEVFNNIFDHSESHISGYVITQYYPNKNKLSFSVCDFGLGIPYTVNKYRKDNNKKPIDDCDALFRAIKPGFSVKTKSHNRGFGLDNIVSFVEANNGYIQIISNNGGLQKKTGGDYKLGTTNFNFSGTLIKVNVDTTYFNEVDETEEIYDF